VTAGAEKYASARLSLKGHCVIPHLKNGTLTLALVMASGVVQAFPIKPVRVLVPLTPGGGADIIARVVSQRLTETLGQQFVVDNRPGAGGSVAYELLARSNPDGHTLALATGSMVTAQLSQKMPYDTLRDFSGVSTLSAQPYVFTVSSSLPVRNLQEFLALAKARPRAINYASSGIGGLIHLTGELFKASAGIEMTHVPYKGMATAYPDVIGGTVQLAIGAQLSASPHIKSGKLRAIATTKAKRMASMPELPTIAESGVPGTAGFEVVQWYGIITPVRTPAQTVQVLNREINKALQQPEVKSRMEADGSEPTGSTPPAFDAFMRGEFAKWGKVIKIAGIKRD
jgi:tripartite-type tricarboxylate transporter receptor subunit TctC